MQRNINPPISSIKQCIRFISNKIYTYSQPRFVCKNRELYHKTQANKEGKLKTLNLQLYFLL
ncbi:hypothetical protein MKW94_012513, partial [Papaver nudicaule]|nr:hypothetical protein [Papaver nudicaule]